MNSKIVEAYEYVVKAREALRRGDPKSARQLGERAALLAPEMEDVWLVLAASDPNPQDALAYARRALELKPESMRAHKGVEWASGRLEQARASNASVAITGSSRNEEVAKIEEKHAYQTAIPFPELESKGINWLYPALLIGAGCMLVGLIALFALTSPALASIVRSVSAPVPTQENLWAPVEIPKTELTPINVSAFAPQLASTPTDVPTDLPPTSRPTKRPTSTPTEIPTDTPIASQTPEATETPGTLAMEIIPDTPTSEYVPPTSSGPKPDVASSGNGVRWIDVDLTNQRVYAYEGDIIVNSFIVSTGTWRTPTVTGKFKVYIRLRSGNMRGPGYFLPDVPYIMYFHGDYGLHGTYWHNNFGTPMSHGCVNLSIDDAAWLYNWSYLGTVVNVHY
ncbi:MAG TPA: L,D-transpeptidase family protein [Anaerolineales bacterium]